jgi:WD40 repeat protein
VSRSQGIPKVAVFVYDNSGHFTPKVFSSNVGANTFGPVVKITDSNNFGSVPPPIAYDSATNQAVLGGGPGCFLCRPVIGVVDLVNSTLSEFNGIGFGFINGIAIDPDDGIFCTTTEDDANVEFYDLKAQTGFTVQLPNSGGQQFYSGADVEFDPIHKLFFVAQPNSSVSSGSTIYVYDVHGTLQKTLNGFKFSNTFNVIPMHIALNPARRIGFVDGPDPNVTDIQSFTY